MSSLPRSPQLVFAFSSPPPKVRLVHAFDRPYENVVATARTCYSAKGIITEDQASAQARTAATRSRKSIYEAGHHTTFQHAHFQFALENVSRQFLWTLPALATRSTTPSRCRSATWRSSRATTPCRPMGAAEREIYERTARRQQDAYTRLTELLTPLAGRALLRPLPGAHARRRPRRASRARSRSGRRRSRATCCRSRRSRTCTTRSRASRSSATGGSASRIDAPTEQREVVGQMVAEVLRHDPLYATVLQEPLPLEETPEYAAFAALPRVRGRPRAPSGAEFDAELGGRVSRLVDWKANNEEILAAAVREILGRPARRALRRRRDRAWSSIPSQQPHPGRDADPDDARQALARALPPVTTPSARSSRTPPTARTSATA